MQRLVVFSFKNETQGGLIVFSANVLLKMDGNALYLVHQKDVDQLKITAQAYSNAFNAASTNDEVLNLVKDRKYLELIKQLELVAIAVDNVAKGDKAYIIGAGFKVRKDAQALSELPAPTNFSAKNHDRNGAVTLSWDVVLNRVNYTVQMRIVGEENWKEIASLTPTSFTINDLTRGLHVEFRVRATGTRNIVGDWTRIIDVFVD